MTNLDISDLKNLIRTTKLFIKSNGELVLLQQSSKEIPLWFLMEKVVVSSRPYFLSMFLTKEITISPDLTIKNLVLGLSCWYDFLNSYCLKNFQSYVEYFNKKMVIPEEDLCKEINLYKKNNIKKHIEYKKGIPFIELRKNLKNNMIENDYYNLNEYIYIELVSRINGNDIKYDSDPCIDVNCFRDAKINLCSTGFLYLKADLINPEGNYIFENVNQDQFLSKYYGKEYFIKTNVEFTLDDILKTLSSLLYFEHPITQEEQQNNAKNFCERVAIIEEKINMDEVIVPAHELLFNTISEDFHSFKIKKIN